MKETERRVTAKKSKVKEFVKSSLNSANLYSSLKKNINSFRSTIILKKGAFGFLIHCVCGSNFLSE